MGGRSGRVIVTITAVFAEHAIIIGGVNFLG